MNRKNQAMVGKYTRYGSYMGNNISSRRTKPSSNWYRLINAFGIFFWKGHVDMASWPLTKKHQMLFIYLLEIVEQNRETPHRKIKMGFWKKNMWRKGVSVPKQCQHSQKNKNDVRVSKLSSICPEIWHSLLKLKPPKIDSDRTITRGSEYKAL